MQKQKIVIMKMDRNDRLIMMRALYAEFCANREAGRPNERHVALFLRLRENPPGKFSLNDDEYYLVRDALNYLRNERIAAGGYTDAADGALIHLAKAKPPLWPFRKY